MEFALGQIPAFLLTNEFGRPFQFADLKGKSVALTFFFTRCPIPEFCPRLTRNFKSAIEKLGRIPAGPTNFHFLSISFDPADSPSLLRSYARQYGYDSNHWSFITGHPEHIAELARGFGVPLAPEGGLVTHGFRTAVFDTAGTLQNVWPIGGDLTDLIVSEMVKAAGLPAVTTPGAR